MRFLSPVVPALSLLFLLGPAACQSPNESMSSRGVVKGTVTHVVIMWLYDRADTSARDELLKAGKRLEAIPGVVRLVGGRVLPSERAVVDSSFDLAFVFTFDHEDDMRRYLDNPVHMDIKKNVLDRYVKKCQVYDIISD